MVWLVVFPACSKYSNDPELSLARDFIDAYYVMADQQKAITLSTGSAKDKLESEINLLKDVTTREDAYRSRDVMFELKRSQDRGREMVYFYELTIRIPDIGDQKRLVNLMVDKELKKITYFAEVQE